MRVREHLTQTDIILDLLRVREWVSALDMNDRYIMRGAARIHDLREKGYKIESRTKKGRTYAEYRLISEPWQEVA